MSGFFAVPLDLQRLTTERASQLIGHMCAKPDWFNAPMTPEEIDFNCKWMLTDENWWKFEIWKGGEFAGMFLLNRISPKVDALYHFTIFPGVPLFGLQRLIHAFLGYVFDAFQLQRISVEIPEQHPKLIRFFRTRLGFRYENEVSLGGHPLVTLLQTKDARKLNLHMTDPVPWLARIGSRKENGHWDGEQFRDLILLRLLRSEYDHQSVISPASEHGANAAREHEEMLDVARGETRDLPATDAARDAARLPGGSVQPAPAVAGGRS